MPDLVALDLPGGPAFVDALRRLWDNGDAALPIDQRLPAPARSRLLDALAPAAVVGADGRRHPCGGGQPTEHGDALVVATSGTTGDPKGVVLTHDAVAAHAAAVHQRLGVEPAQDRWLACLPLGHIGGLGVVTRAIVTGTPLEMLPGFDGPAVEASVRERGSTLVSLVPTALDRISPAPWRWVVLGGSPDRHDRPANVVRTYGMTETGGGIVYEGSPLAGTEVWLANGEIHLRGPTLLRCYRDGTDPRTADGWLPTGDLGDVDGSGRLTVAGRRGDLIITGGENVWPEAVEAVLRTHPSVADVAVVGRPDQEWGTRVVALVVAEPGMEGPTLAALRGHAKATLPAHAAPRQVELVTALPRTALGKLRRSALRDPSGP